MSVSGIGSKQKYVGVPISLDKPVAEVVEKVPFECHRCHNTVDTEKGFYVTHYRLKLDRYGGNKTVLCAASNNKVKAELRSFTQTGTCDQCGTDVEVTVTEEYPGGLTRYGGFDEVSCPICDGKTHASCDQPDCGLLLTEINGAWVHTDSNSDDCPNSGEVWYVFDLDQTLPTTTPAAKAVLPRTGPFTHVKIAGPFTTEKDAIDEYDKLQNAPTATGNENYEVASETTPPTKASPFAPTIKANPVHKVLMYDGFTIEELDD